MNMSEVSSQVKKRREICLSVECGMSNLTTNKPNV
jgi:hypothetical protein